jgi:uncharacterized protein DUF6328
VVLAEADRERGESAEQRLDRNLLELLNELRVALPGVQVLFAFLLTVPFTQRFAALSDFQENVYYLTLISAAVSAALLIAPSAYHRILFRRRDKAHLVTVSNRLAIAGLGALAVAMTGVVLLITELVFENRATTIAVTAAIGTMFAVLWYLAPLRRLRKLG